MWIRRERIVLLVAFMVMTVFGMAQPKVNSPFSRYGFGDLQERDFVPVFSMGGIGAVYHNPYVTNIVNPAALGFIEATSLETAASARLAFLEKDDFQQNIWSGNFDYLSLSIPLINPLNDLLERRSSYLSGTLHFSLTPYSRVGYLVRSFSNVDSVGDVRSNFTGTGGTSRFNVATGWKYKNISVGATFSYMFGDMEYQSETILSDLENNYEHIGRRNYTVRGILYDIGAMYVWQISNVDGKNPKDLTFGVHWRGNTSFRGEEDYLNFVINPTYGIADTAVALRGAEVDGQLPGTLGFGIMYEERSKWRIGLTYQQEWWSNYENSARPEMLSDSWRIALGGGITPDYTDITSYFNRMEYRAGVHYGTDPRSLGGTQIEQYGFSVGIGFPFIQPRFFTFIDLGIEYGWRGVVDNLKEDYLSIKLGLNLNDTQWFIKRRYR